MVRIQGLAIGIDVGDEDYADTVQDTCRRNGLLVSTEGSTVLLPVAGDRPAYRRERPGHSGALDLMVTDEPAGHGKRYCRRVPRITLTLSSPKPPGCIRHLLS